MLNTSLINWKKVDGLLPVIVAVQTHIHDIHKMPRGFPLCPEAFLGTGIEGHFACHCSTCTNQSGFDVGIYE